MNEPDAARPLPLFPLGTVLFPDGLLRLKIFETRYLDLMSRCMREASTFGVVGLASGSEMRLSDEPVVLLDVGTHAEVIDVDSAQAGILHVTARGARRFRLRSSRQQTDGLWVGEATDLAPDADVAPNDDHAGVVQSLADAIAALAQHDASPFLPPHRLDSAGWVANRWSELLPIPVEAKAKLLVIADPLARLALIDSFMRSSRQGSH